MLTALIMAGGQGTRFWPLSTEEKPKQFLSLINEKTMIQMTVERIRPIISIDKIFICTGERYVELVKKQLPDLPERNIIIEPEGRNTTPCITLSALVIDRYYKGANMLVLPSDHLIKNEDMFRKIILNANKFVKSYNRAIVTLGMKPSRPEIGYGYIKCSNEEKELNGNRVIKVEAFVEKPNKEVAEEYLSQGNYLWNGGMFLWSVKNIIDQIKMYSSNTYEALSDIKNISEKNLQQFIDDNYRYTEAISVDYAVLEKSSDIYVIPSNFGWDDVGSWEALDRYRKKSKEGNILIGETKALNCKNNLLVSSNQKIVVAGLSNIYVIESDGKILIGNKSDVSNVRELRKIL